MPPDLQALYDRRHKGIDPAIYRRPSSRDDDKKALTATIEADEVMAVLASCEAGKSGGPSGLTVDILMRTA